ncbi:hypothetical protein TNCV_2743261 [Trichonephila clavipes]|nr:hypothetical protein TNCV_2743261 [Trichonephila clavipes]
MPVDVEYSDGICRVLLFIPAKKREDLKECFDFSKANTEKSFVTFLGWLKVYLKLLMTLSSWGPLKRYFIERGFLSKKFTALWAYQTKEKTKISGEANPAL